MVRTIIVVDDDALVLDVLTAMLEDLGCNVVAVQNPHEALELLRSRPDVSALITDVNMPAIDGAELARGAQEVSPGIGVLLVSGKPQPSMVYPVLRKPFSVGDLARVMESTIGRC